VNFLADESVDVQIVDRLRADGHDVLAVVDMEPGISDDSVLNFANEHDALLLTADKDFGELVFRQGRVFKGVVLVRLAGLSLSLKAAIVSGAIRDRGAELLETFTVISPGMVRLRPRNW
jgi:predicted nuclease of predicted toxin-antitoxin system